MGSTEGGEEPTLRSHKERYLLALTDVSTVLLDTSDLEVALPEVVRILRDTSGADHCGLATVYRNGAADWQACIRFEAAAPGVPPASEGLRDVPFSLAALGLGDLLEKVLRGEELAGEVRSFAGRERDFMQVFGVSWIAGLPIRVAGELWGVLGFATRRPGSRFDPAFIPLLRVAANTLGAAIGRERAESRRLASESRHRILLENAWDLVLELDPAGRICFVSRRCRELLGYTPEEVLAVPTLLPCEDGSRIARILEATLTGRRVEAEMLRARHRDGSERILEVNATSYRTPLGELRAVLTGRDVTARLRAMETVSALVRGVEAEIGEAFFHSLARTLAEALGADFAEIAALVPREDGLLESLAYWDGSATRAGARYAAAGTLAEPVLRGELSACASGARERFPRDPWLAAAGIESYVAIPLRGNTGQVIGLMAVLSRRALADPQAADAVLRILGARAAAEIERKRTEDARASLAAALEQAGEAVGVVDPARLRVLYANPAWRRAAAAIPVASAAELWRSVGRANPALAEEIMRTYQAGRVWSGRLPVEIDPDQRLFFDVTISPVRGEAGRVASIVVLARDVTREARLEAEFAQAQKMEAIGTLAGGVAHDFNNLLTGILGYASLLRGDPYPFHEVQEMAAVIEEAAKRGGDLTAQLLGLTGSRPRMPVRVDVHQAVEDVVRLLQRTIPRSIRIECELGARSARVVWARGQLEQVLLNLCLNARDAMPEGGTLRLTTHDAPADSRDGLELCVHDTGHGIPESNLDRIFEPFFTTKSLGEGTGLGLSMVYSLVRSHGGSVRVRSHEGQGAEFCLWLPRASVGEEAPASEPPAVRGAAAGRVLVVDDDHVARRAVVAMLRDLGHEVVEEEDGERGLERYQRERGRLQAVLLDLDMPRTGGLACLEGIRKLDATVPILVCTGAALSSRVEELARSGHCLLLPKPFGVESLAGALSRATG